MDTNVMGTVAGKDNVIPEKQLVYKSVFKLIAAYFYCSGLVKLARWWMRRSGKRLVVLNYHCATGGDLRQHLLYLRRHYRVLHLEAALEELYAPCTSRLAKGDRRTPLVLTFDDGYHDNYTHAFKLACELQVPITIFLIPGYLESGRRFWWFEGDHLVAHTQMSEVTIGACTYHLNRSDERKALAQAIYTRARYATSVNDREAFLASVREVMAEPAPGVARDSATLPLTWAQVQVMEESGWVSFGAHTMYHPVLAYLADPLEVQYEVSECRAVLERQLGHPVRTFAYPIGQFEHIGKHGLRAVQEAGYAWALSTVYGFNTPQSNPYLLRRLEVDVDQHWLEIAAKASGIWGFFSRPCRTLIERIRRLGKGR